MRFAIFVITLLFLSTLSGCFGNDDAKDESTVTQDEEPVTDPMVMLDFADTDTLESTNSVNATGGTISAGQSSLVLPEGALSKEVNLTLRQFTLPEGYSGGMNQAILSTTAVQLDINQTTRYNGSIQISIPATDAVDDDPGNIVLGVVRGGVVVPQDIPLTYNAETGMLVGELTTGVLLPADLNVIDVPRYAGWDTAIEWGAWLYRNGEALVAIKNHFVEEFLNGPVMRYNDNFFQIMVPQSTADRTTELENKKSYILAKSINEQLLQARTVLHRDMGLYIPTAENYEHKDDPQENDPVPYKVHLLNFAEVKALPNNAKGVTIPSSPSMQGMTFINTNAGLSNAQLKVIAVHEYIHAVAPSAWNGWILEGLSELDSIPEEAEIPFIDKASIAADLIEWTPDQHEENQWFFEGLTVALAHHIVNGSAGTDPMWDTSYAYQTSLLESPIPGEFSHGFFAYIDQLYTTQSSAVHDYEEYSIMLESVKPFPKKSIGEDSIDTLESRFYFANFENTFKVHLAHYFGKNNGFYTSTQGPRATLSAVDCELTSTLPAVSLDYLWVEAGINITLTGEGVHVLAVTNTNFEMATDAIWNIIGSNSLSLQGEDDGFGLVLFHSGDDSRETITVEVNGCVVDEPSEPEQTQYQYRLNRTFTVGSGSISYDEMDDCPDDDEPCIWEATYDSTGFTYTEYNESRERYTRYDFYFTELFPSVLSTNTTEVCSSADTCFDTESAQLPLGMEIIEHREGGGVDNQGWAYIGTWGIGPIGYVDPLSEIGSQFTTPQTYGCNWVANHWSDFNNHLSFYPNTTSPKSISLDLDVPVWWESTAATDNGGSQAVCFGQIENLDYNPVDGFWLSVCVVIPAAFDYETRDCIVVEYVREERT